MLSLTRVSYWLYGCLRCTPFALVAIAFVFSSCSSAPTSARPAFSAPSSAKVGTKISTAQSAIAKAVTVHAKEAAAKLTQLETLTTNTPELHELAAGAHSEIDSLTSELTNAQSALTDAESARADLQRQVETQTDQLNATVLEKNEALRLESVAEQKADRALKQRNRLVLLSLGLLIWIFRQPLLQLGGRLIQFARLACGIP